MGAGAEAAKLRLKAQAVGAILAKVVKASHPPSDLTLKGTWLQVAAMVAKAAWAGVTTTCHRHCRSGGTL